MIYANLTSQPSGKCSPLSHAFRFSSLCCARLGLVVALLFSLASSSSTLATSLDCPLIDSIGLLFQGMEHLHLCVPVLFKVALRVLVVLKRACDTVAEPSRHCANKLIPGQVKLCAYE